MARKKTPAAERIGVVRAKRLSSGSALAQLQLELLRPEAHDVFENWRTHPLTMLMIESVRELSVTPPVAYIDTDSVATQYGVSSGLSLASAFLSDPCTLYPFLFSGAAPGKPLQMPEADYSSDAYPVAAGAGK